MPSIANYTVVGWLGRIRPAARIIESVAAAPGYDGSLAVLGGYRTAPETVVTTADVASMGQVVSLVNGYRRLTGTPVTVVDQFATTYTNVFVETMLPTWDFLATGGLRVTAVWVLVYQSAPPGSN